MVRPVVAARKNAPARDVVFQFLKGFYSGMPVTDDEGTVIGVVKELEFECLIEYEGNAFAFTGEVEQDLLSITSVHPMRRDAVDAYLERAGANGSVVRNY